MPGRRLSWDERVQIFRLCRKGWSVRAVAECLGRAPSTVSRELRRETGHRRYAAIRAHQHAMVLARRPKAFKLEGNGPLARVVSARLKRKWSPEQIAHRLRRDHPGDPRWHVAPETIYSSLFADTRGGLADELRRQLRSGQGRRGARGDRASIKNKTMIWDRPKEVWGRSVPGHWEGDLLVPRNSRSAIATLVERTTRFTMLVALPHATAAEGLKNQLCQVVQTLPTELFRSLTWDQGKEMTQHLAFTVATDVQVYFCEPRKPWQRGTNENTNRLIRQYYPKSTDFSRISQAELDQVAEELNSRPRKTLDWDTPAERFQQLLNQDGVATTP